MHPTIDRSVDTLDAHEREAFESVVGFSLQPEQRVMVLVYTPGVIPDEATRQTARENLDGIYRKGDAFAAASGVTQQQYDAAVAEAIEQVRPERSA